MMMGNEGGGEFTPEPPPEPLPEASPELRAETAPEAPPAEPGAAEMPPPETAAPEAPAEARIENAGADQDVLREGVTADDGIDIAKVQEAASHKMTDELAERLSDAGVDAPRETVATGNLSANPEHAATELAAVREHAEQRAAYLVEQAKTTEADEARQAQALADEAAELEASWRAEQAGGDGPEGDAPPPEPPEVDTEPADGRNLGKFREPVARADGSTHHTYHLDKVNIGTPAEPEIWEPNVHLSWDVDAQGNRINSHLTDKDRDEEGRRKKPIDF